MNKCSKPGFTLIEVMITVLLLSLLLGTGNSILSYSRQQTEKGFWIQQAIAQLRNTTRLIGIKMKETSYPSTLVKSKSGGIDTDSIYSFKERRKYDDIGRLRALDINTSDVYNMHTISTDGNTMAASYDDRTIMYFPICTPEIIVNGSKQSGTGIITWVHFVFRPAKNYSVTGLGSIYMDEHEVSYSTKSPDYAYGLGKPSEAFSTSWVPTRSKELITDVSGIKVDTFSVSESKGQAVSKEGVKGDVATVKKNLVSITINCCHPKDGKITLYDQCSVISRVELTDDLVIPPSIQLIKVIKSGERALVKYGNDSATEVGLFDPVGPGKVVKIYSTSIKVEEGGMERLVVQSPEE
ncbi:MAG: hypothetical protein BWY02_00783 [bacterium ADurb.Bin157]|jgi:prepilin-type N-terminal cleavage/methylation domain-containing protein|nr:MAG: hypothetical protein BWY02_00783 [bacterium ADurb.Bin157]